LAKTLLKARKKKKLEKHKQQEAIRKTLND